MRSVIHRKILTQLWPNHWISFCTVVSSTHRPSPEQKVINRGQRRNRTWVDLLWHARASHHWTLLSAPLFHNLIRLPHSPPPGSVCWVTPRPDLPGACWGNTLAPLLLLHHPTYSFILWWINRVMQSSYEWSYDCHFSCNYYLFMDNNTLFFQGMILIRHPIRA